MNKKDKSWGIIIGLSLSILLINFTAFAWTQPTLAPPRGNVSPPLNISAIRQVKSGALGIGGVLRAYSNLIVDGAVGIGTTTPRAILDVYNGDIIVGRPQAIHGATHRQFILHGAWNNLYLAPRNDANTEWLWNTFVINSGGNVGIGTTAPGNRLDVAGTRTNTISPAAAIAGIGGDDVRLYTGTLFGTPNWGTWMQSMNTAGAAQPLMLNPSGGNVGIGTTNPGARLHVAGTGRFEGVLDMSSQRITNIAAPIDPSDAATKAYVGAQTTKNTYLSFQARSPLGDWNCWAECACPRGFTRYSARSIWEGRDRAGAFAVCSCICRDG